MSAPIQIAISWWWVAIGKLKGWALSPSRAQTILIWKSVWEHEPCPNFIIIMRSWYFSILVISPNMYDKHYYTMTDLKTYQQFIWYITVWEYSLSFQLFDDCFIQDCCKNIHLLARIVKMHLKKIRLVQVFKSLSEYWRNVYSLQICYFLVVLTSKKQAMNIWQVFILLEMNREPSVCEVWLDI